MMTLDRELTPEERLEEDRRLAEALKLFDDTDEEEETSFEGMGQAHTTAEETSIPSSSHAGPSPTGDSTTTNNKKKKRKKKKKEGQKFAWPPLQRVHQALQATEAFRQNLNLVQCAEPVWTDYRTLYFGPVVYQGGVDSIGGGRGLLAACDIPAGTLLVKDRPFLTWPEVTDELPFDLISIRALMSSSNAQERLQAMKLLHPVSLDEIPADKVAEKRKEAHEEVAALARDYAHLGLTEDEVLRLMFAVQCNGYSSGLYLHLSLFNHSCYPNCVKYSGNEEEDGSPYSEVRAARDIKKGEALTIAYLHPIEQSTERRQKQLTRQFFFTCRCEFCTGRTPLLDAIICPNHKRKSCPGLVDWKSGKCQKCRAMVDTGRISSALESIQDRLSTAHELLAAGQARDCLDLTLDLMSELLEIVHPQHIVTVQIHKLVSDASERLLRTNAPGFKEHALLFLRSCMELLEIQQSSTQLLHPDVGRTLNDISQGVQLLLSLNPTLLFKEFPELGNFNQASHIENETRKAYLHIRSLYE